MNEIRLLQIGPKNCKTLYDIPGYMEWFYGDDVDEESMKAFDIILLFGDLNALHRQLLQRYQQCYRLFVVNEEVSYDEELLEIFSRNRVVWLEKEDLQHFLTYEARNFFADGYGEKYRMKNLGISPMFRGMVEWNGDYSVYLKGDFGRERRQIVFWRNNIPVFKGQAIDLWLEYERSPEVSIEMEITQYVNGSLSEIQNHWFFSEEDMRDVVTIDNEQEDGNIFVSIRARGNGWLKIIALHDRYSRRGHGYFIPGGERHVTSGREEFFSYFEPGDRKPPLNVYFAGYKTQQTFEGLHMMRRFGCPFVLLSEPRLEGGCFYIGNEEYESSIKKVLQGYLDELGFEANQMIFSGLSMGTYGAFYYGCDFKPHAILVGKPLTSVGNIAKEITSYRPEVFQTAVDVLRVLEKDLSEEAVQRLNERFWSKLRNTVFEDTRFIMAYMIEDDYDADAYQRFLDNLQGTGVKLYGKGLHGRHNDDTNGVVQWFRKQYMQIIQKDFDRE